MDRTKLLNVFLGAYPNSFHPCDNERFLKYAIACALEEGSIDSQAMLDGGVFEENVERYEVAYSWIRETVEYLINHLDLGNDIHRLEDSLS